MIATRRMPLAASGIPEVAARKGHSTNLVGVPTGLLASEAFNRAGVRLGIAGVREANPGLFRMLEAAATAEHAAAVFTAYMEVVFGLYPEQRGRSATGDGRRRYRSSYVRLLRGWAWDSNGPEGAVMKGWVESRFGLFPTFHREPVRKFSSDAWIHYVEQKMNSRFHNNAIFSQLDLLYEFTQWSLARFEPTVSMLRLFRGVNDFEEHAIVAVVDPRTVVVRLNNLASFTGQRDIATWFGSWILEADVPVCKIAFFNALLPQAPLKGEAEYLVIGGDYRVSASYF